MDNSYKIFGQYFNDIGITFRQHFHWFLRPWAWKGQGELKTLLLSLLMIHWHMIWCGLILYSKVWCDIFPVANKEMKFAFCLLSLFIAFLRTTWLSTIHYNFFDFYWCNACNFFDWINLQNLCIFLRFFFKNLFQTQI